MGDGERVILGHRVNGAVMSSQNESKKARLAVHKGVRASI